MKIGCEALIWEFFEKGGQVVIYDANNGTAKARQDLAEKFDKAGIHVVFLGASYGLIPRPFGALVDRILWQSLHAPTTRS